MTTRLNIAEIISGARGRGKTTYGEAVQKKTSQKTILVVDTIDHPAYRGWTTLSSNEADKNYIGRYKGFNANDGKKRKVRIFGSNCKEIWELVEKYVYNTLIIAEDCIKQLDNPPQHSVRKAILDSKQKNNDFLFMYHSLSDVPPRLYRWCDYVTIFYTQEDITSRKQIPNLASIAAAHAEVCRVAGGAKEKTAKYCYHKTVKLG